MLTRERETKDIKDDVERRSGATAGSSLDLKSAEQNPMKELKFYTRFPHEHISSFSYYNCLDLPVMLVYLCVFLMIKNKIRILIAHRHKFSCACVFNREPSGGSPISHSVNLKASHGDKKEKASHPWCL